MLGVIVSVSCHTLTCGPGTELQGGSCVAAGDSDAGGDSDTPPTGPHYELSLPSSIISADGESKVAVHASGTNADGSPALDSVVFAMSRAGAGSFDSASAELGPKGATVYFTPCNALTPGCTGSVDLTLALSAEPAAAVASTTIEIVVPDALADVAPCLVGGNAFFLDGEGSVFDGTMTVLDGDWDANNYFDQEVTVEVVPSDEFQGLWWAGLFASPALDEDLAVGLYEHTDQVLNGQAPGHPGMLIRGTGTWCTEIDGQFQIYEIGWIGDLLDVLTVSFEQYCDTETVPLTGCIHYQE